MKYTKTHKDQNAVNSGFYYLFLLTPQIINPCFYFLLDQITCPLLFSTNQKWF